MRRLDRSGFTLVEAMVSVAIMAIVLLGVSEFLVNTTRNTAKFSITSQNKGDLRSAQSLLTAMLETASISLQFQHLAANFQGAGACTAAKDWDQACVEQLNGSDILQPVTKLPSGFNSSIEFFRDQSAALTITDLPPSPGFLPIVYSNSTAGITQADFATVPSFFTSWKMHFTIPGVDPPVVTTQPFPVLRTSPSADIFTVSTAAVSPGSSTVAVNPIGSSVTTDVNNSLVLGYDSANPSIYQIEKVTVTTPTSLTLSDVASDANFANMYNPNPPILDNGYWPGQGGSFYPFPTQVVPFSDPLNSNYFSSPVNLTELAYYFWQTTTTGSPTFAIVPIVATAYYLRFRTSFTDHPCDSVVSLLQQNKQPNPATSPYSAKLVMVNWVNPPTVLNELTVLDRVCGDVVFARQLGTTGVSVFVYNNWPSGSL